LHVHESLAVPIVAMPCVVWVVVASMVSPALVSMMLVNAQARTTAKAITTKVTQRAVLDK
jgi:hypothetical protein